MNNQKTIKSTKSEKITYILIPVKTIKSDKLNPKNDINKHINKYNSKNKNYYYPTTNNNLTNNIYLTNSDIYI